MRLSLLFKLFHALMFTTGVEERCERCRLRLVTLTSQLYLATRQHHEAASPWLPTTSSSSAWRPSARKETHLPSTSTIGTRGGTSLPFRTATGAATARGAALPPSRCPEARAPCRSCATILGQARLGEFHRLLLSFRTPVLLLPPLLLLCEIRPLLPLNYQNLRM